MNNRYVVSVASVLADEVHVLAFAAVLVFERELVSNVATMQIRKPAVFFNYLKGELRCPNFRLL